MNLPKRQLIQEVANNIESCCELDWDGNCQAEYDYLAAQETPDDGSFDFNISYTKDLQLIIDDEDKILINRILNVPAFRQKYLDIVCVMLENNFQADRLFPLINQQTELIRPAIYEDPNYIYTWDYFEYDAGNGSGGGGDASIPSLKRVLNERFAAVSENLSELGHTCENAFSSVDWQDLVINELMADNTENSDIVDTNGEAEDWIELYNNSGSDIDLSRFYLSDRNEDLFKWNFPTGTVISPDDYLIIWGDKDEEQLGIHANFKLSKSGEGLYLMHEDGTMADSLNFGEQITDMAYARSPNGFGNFIIQSPTFAVNNDFINNLSDEEINLPFNVFPNPTQQYLNINFISQLYGKATISIKNIMGENMSEEHIIYDQRIRMDLSNLSSGIYFLEVATENEKWVEKIILSEKD